MTREEYQKLVDELAPGHEMCMKGEAKGVDGKFTAVWRHDFTGWSFGTGLGGNEEDCEYIWCRKRIGPRIWTTRGEVIHALATEPGLVVRGGNVLFSFDEERGPCYCFADGKFASASKLEEAYAPWTEVEVLPKPEPRRWGPWEEVATWKEASSGIVNNDADQRAVLVEVSESLWRVMGYKREWGLARFDYYVRYVGESK